MGMEVQIISGFMGAGKTTFLNRYLPLLAGTTAVIINDNGNIQLDKKLFSDQLSVRKMISGCICCTLINDFRQTIRQIAGDPAPDRIVIEASGIGKLSDVEKACQSLADQGVDLRVTKKITLIDSPEHDAYAAGLGAFYLDQVRAADIILPCHMGDMDRKERRELFAVLREENPKAAIYEDDYRDLSDEKLYDLIKTMNIEYTLEGACEYAGI